MALLAGLHNRRISLRHDAPHPHASVGSSGLQFGARSKSAGDVAVEGSAALKCRAGGSYEARLILGGGKCFPEIFEGLLNTSLPRDPMLRDALWKSKSRGNINHNIELILGRKR